MAPFLTEVAIVELPTPVAPAIASIAHAAPTPPSSPLEVISSYSSVSAPGDVVNQILWFLLSAICVSIITAALLLAVVIAFAVEVPEFVTFIVPGSTSNGPPTTPFSLTPPVVSMLEKAIILPIPISVVASSVKTKLAPSVPSATRYNIVPLQELLPASLIKLPCINAQPLLAAFVKVILLDVSLCKIFAIMTSPAKTPVGLFTVKEELVVVAVVAVPLCAI